MAPARRCSECGASLEGRSPSARTCTDKCREARKRRLKRADKQRSDALAAANTLPDHLQPLTQAIAKDDRKVTDIVHETFKEELRPVVREAITEDVLRAVGQMMRLTPRMVSLIEADMADPDPSVRQKAYTLLAKYTLGNPSVAPASAEAVQAPMQVVFNLPRPGSSAPESAPEEAVELRECCECHQHKPTDEFVANSERCSDCHEEVQARVRARFGE